MTTAKDAEAQKSNTDALTVFFTNRDKISKEKCKIDLEEAWNEDDFSALFNDIEWLAGWIIDVYSNSLDI